jgi:hypothetical protein
LVLSLADHLALPAVRPDPDTTPTTPSYLVHARFEHQDAVALLVTVSRSGEVEGLELYPRDE